MDSLPTDLGFWFISKTNKEEELPVVLEAGSKQDLCVEMLAAKLERVGIKDKVNACAQLDTSKAVNPAAFR